MKNKKWKTFDKLTWKCYLNMAGAEKDWSCWCQAFELLKEIILEERKANPGFAAELEMVDYATDYQYDIQGWLDDCLGEMDIRGEHQIFLNMCEDLLTMFSWSEYTDSDLKFQKVSALKGLGRMEEASQYCKEWIKKEPENMVAATAGVYVFIGTKEFGEAEELVDRFILDKSKCLDENDIIFTAASILYGAMGKKKEKKQIDKAIKEYEEHLKQCFENSEFDADDMEFWDEEDLPFN